MITASDASALARQAIFRIAIEPKSGSDWWWGTGFFVSPAGHALTAFHNLPAAVAAERRGQVTARDQGRAAFTLDFVPMQDDRERDIALLRASSGHQERFAHLPMAALDHRLSPRERARFWAGRAVLVCGFPFAERTDTLRSGQQEDAIPGHVRGDAPFGIEDEKDGDDIPAQVERLRIVPDKSVGLPGISGGPVIDLETGFVVAVDGAVRDGRILASELKPNVPGWPDAVRDKLTMIGAGAAPRRRVLWILGSGVVAVAAGVFVWPAGPAITIEEPIPPYDPEGGDTTSATISGRVSGVDPQHVRVVVYTFTNKWYVQPTVQHPMTPVSRDRRWRADGIHTGRHYAVLLVKDGFRPEPESHQLPVNDPHELARDIKEGGRR